MRGPRRSLPDVWPQPNQRHIRGDRRRRRSRDARALEPARARAAAVRGRRDATPSALLRARRSGGRLPAAHRVVQPSPPFRLKPWYESGDAPPMQIELPPLSVEAMSKLKPNVAFKVPPELQQFMDKLNLKDAIDGKVKKGLNISFGMICGFSIPLITICAFIVLQIFLVLFNILFFWLPFIRICIPFPKISNNGGGG